MLACSFCVKSLSKDKQAEGAGNLPLNCYLTVVFLIKIIEQSMASVDHFFIRCFLFISIVLPWTRRSFSILTKDTMHGMVDRRHGVQG